MQRRLNPVYRSLNSPLTLMGAERKLFFFAMVMGATVFNLLHTFLGGLLMFALLYCFARWATKTDSQILHFLLNSAKTRAQYDPMKFSPIPARGIRHA
ncbi:MAG: VirB3 family type IV secretion system protein [Acidobacteria bacterium]|nr:VirB3 family type IV secretion system protein [Acidobacteriota bacterium]